MAAFSIFSKTCQKCILSGLKFLTPQTQLTQFSLMCIIYAKCSEAVANSGYANVCSTINNPLKMLPRHFRYFHCSNFQITFDKKSFVKKLPFSNFFQISTMLQNITFCQQNGGPLNNYQNLQKTSVLFAYITKFRIYTYCYLWV